MVINMKKIKYLFFVLFLIIVLSSCVSTSKNSSSSTSGSESGKKYASLNPSDICYENEYVIVKGISDNADLIKLYFYDDLFVQIRYSAEFNKSVISHKHSVYVNQIKNNSLIFKAEVFDKNGNYGEFTKTIPYLGTVSLNSVLIGESYLKFDALPNVSKYKVKVGNGDEEIYDSNEITFDYSLNDRVAPGERYADIEITPYSDEPHFSYKTVYRYEKITSVSNISFLSNQITFTSPDYDGKWRIVINEADEIVDEIITTKSFDYTPKGSDFSISINGYLNDKPITPVTEEVKAINNLESISFNNKYILLNDSSETGNRSYNYQLKVKNETISSGTSSNLGINYDNNYYRYLGNDVLLIARKSLAKNEYLVGETNFNLKCIQDLYVTSTLSDSNIINNELVYTVSSRNPGSKLKAYLYDGNNELVDYEEFEYTSRVTSKDVTFKYDDVDKYKVVIERELLPEDGFYYMNLSRLHTSYEYIYDIPDKIDVSSVENRSTFVRIDAEDLKDTEVTLYQGSTKVSTNTGTDTTFTIAENKFNVAKVYDLYFVSKTYTKSEKVLCTNFSKTGSLFYISENYPADTYKVELYNERDVFLASKLNSDANSHSFNLSGKSYNDVYMVFIKTNTYSQKFNITKLDTPTLSIEDNTLKFSGGENYELLDGDTVIYDNTNLVEYLINYDNLKHSYKLKSLADNSKFEINSSYTAKMDITFIDNPVIDVYDQTISWDNLKDNNYNYDVYINDVLTNITDTEINISDYIDTNNQIVFKVTAKSENEYILSSQQISYTINKRIASNFITNPRISNSDSSILFTANNETYSYQIYNQNNDMIIKNTTKATSIPVSLEPGEYRINLSIASKIDNDNHTIEMTSTEKIGLVFVQDGVIDITRSKGSKYTISRVTNDVSNVSFKMFVDETLNTTTTSNVFTVDLSTQEVGTKNILIQDNSSNTLADSERRFKFKDYTFEQEIVKAEKLTVSKYINYPKYTLYYNSAFYNDLSYSTIISIGGKSELFPDIEYTRYYNKYYLYLVALSNGINPTLQDTKLSQSTSYNYDSTEGCYRVFARTIADDFNNKNSLYTLSSDRGYIDYSVTAPIYRADIGIRDGSASDKKGLLYIRVSQENTYPIAQTSNNNYKVVVSGAGTYDRVFKKSSHSNNLMTLGTEMLTPGINVGRVLQDGDIVNITIYVYNDYGESATLVFNNLSVSHTILNYGYVKN